MRTSGRDAWILAIATVVAAVIGFAGGLVSQRSREPVVPAPAALPTEYEWQWAGERWYGRILLAGQGEDLAVSMARVFELQKLYSDPKTSKMVFADTPLLEALQGSFKRTSTGSVNIDLLVNKATHGHQGYVAHKIAGQLAPVTCLAGKVHYMNTVTSQRSKGDMILVNYESIPDELTGGRFEPHRQYTPR